MNQTDSSQSPRPAPDPESGDWMQDRQWNEFGDDWNPIPDADRVSPDPVEKNERMVAMLCYVTLIFMPFIFPIIVLLSRKRTRFQTFHAVQSLGLGVAVSAFWICLWLSSLGFMVSIPVLGVIMGLLLLCIGPIAWVAVALATLYFAHEAFQGKYVQVPGLFSIMSSQGWIAEP